MGEGKYLEIVLGGKPNSFISIFEAHWSRCLEEMPMRYSHSEQLTTGNRLRPMLVCWGHILSNTDLTKESLEEVAELSVGIELLHKGSIFVDDVIDNDEARHGKKTFHVEHGYNEAVLFSVNLLTYSLERIHKHFRTNTASANDYADKIHLYIETIRNMSTGALEEITNPQSELFIVANVHRLIELQTTSIIKNSLLLGYLTKSPKGEISEYIEKIGSLSGYVFQLLNDLEPFSSEAKTTLHKGVYNIDITKARKNIVVAYLFELMTKSEQKDLSVMLSSGKSSQEVSNTLASLFKKYDIDTLIIDEVEQLYKQINSLITKLGASSIDVERVEEFKGFIKMILIKSFERLGSVYYEKLSPILIN